MTKKATRNYIKQMVAKDSKNKKKKKKGVIVACTFNKMVNGEQITVQFHVDDLKISHKEQAVLEDFLKDFRDEFC